MKTPLELTPLVCPKCGSTGEPGMPHLYIEQTETLRNIGGIGQDGKLHIEADIRVYDADIIPKLFCSNCLHQWNLPESLETEVEDGIIIHEG